MQLNLVRPWLGGLATLLLPPTCAACRRSLGGDGDGDEPLCRGCAATLLPIRRACPRCGLPTPEEGELFSPATPDGKPPVTCLGCLRSPPPWGQGGARFVYGGALATAIVRWKLGPVPELTRPLARLLAPSLARLPKETDGLVPVPLHPRRLRAREFNQAALLARAAAAFAVRAVGRPATEALPIHDLLERTRDTPSQSTLDGEARRKNVRGAFRLRAGASVRGAHLCLVDDVLTTGATASACARALLDGGAAHVDVLTLARALP